MSDSTPDIEEKTLPPMRIAGLRMSGRYEECGRAFAKLARMYGRRISGKPMMLCYDREYKPDDADFEPCFPVSGGEDKSGATVRELPGGKCLALLHLGPYESLHESYQRLRERLAADGRRSQLPSREVYLKGPGMIFKGNPKRYVTEIQVLLDD